MVWIPPNEDSNDNEPNTDFPIIPFSSMLTPESNDLEPWRKKFAKDCNKAKTKKTSRSQKCPLCVDKEGSLIFLTRFSLVLSSSSRLWKDLDFKN